MDSPQRQREILTTFARDNRRDSTDAEMKLWRLLRNRGFDGHKFKRQKVIGNYIVDFVCMAKKLVIELDGGQHNLPDGIAADQERTAALRKRGFRILRFWNDSVLREPDNVMQVVGEALAKTGEEGG